MSHENELNHIKQQALSELDTMTPDQQGDLIKAVLSDVIDLYGQLDSHAFRMGLIARKLDNLANLTISAKAKAAARNVKDDLLAAALELDEKNKHSAALLRQRIAGIDPGTICSEMTKQ